VDRAQLSEFSDLAASARESLFGISAVFRGQTITVLEATASGSMDLELGGPRVGATWAVRIPKSIQPPPAEKEMLHRLADGRNFVITHCDPCPLDSASSRFHYVETELP
jgi:hypothetical protein